jgi:hypothetical protein
VTQLVEDLDDAVRVLVAGLVDEFADDGVAAGDAPHQRVEGAAVGANERDDPLDRVVEAGARRQLRAGADAAISASRAVVTTAVCRPWRVPK